MPKIWPIVLTGSGVFGRLASIGASRMHVFPREDPRSLGEPREQSWDFPFRTFFGGAIPHVVGKRKSMSSSSISEKLDADFRRWLVTVALGVFLGAMIVWFLWSVVDLRDARNAGRAHLEERISAIERAVAELQDERRP